MRLPRLQLLRPGELTEAVDLLQQHGTTARVVAGGTDLLVQLKQRTEQAEYLVSLRGIAGLNYLVDDQEQGLKIGAMTPLARIAGDANIQQNYPALAQAAASVGAPTHQFMGTLGGNLCLNTRCWYYNQSSFWRSARPACLKAGGEVCHAVKKSTTCFAAYSGDTAPALIALGAAVEILGPQGTREMSIEQLYSGDGAKPITLANQEVIREIRVPSTGGAHNTYLKLRPRESIDFPQAGVAVRVAVDGGVFRQVRVVFNAVASAPLRATAVEQALEGMPASTTTLQVAAEAAVRSAQPVKNMVGTPQYRRQMLGVLTSRAVEQLIGQQE